MPRHIPQRIYSHADWLTVSAEDKVLDYMKKVSIRSIHPVQLAMIN